MQFIGMTREPEKVGDSSNFSLVKFLGLKIRKVLFVCVQGAVRRAKMQLKSAMMMNLESRFILCEDIGRSLPNLPLLSSISPYILSLSPHLHLQASSWAEFQVHSSRAHGKDRYFL